MLYAMESTHVLAEKPEHTLDRKWSGERKIQV